MINTIEEKQQKEKEYIEKLEKSTYLCVEDCYGETDILKGTVFKIIEKNKGTYIITDGEKKAEVKKSMLFNHETNDIRYNYVNLNKETEKSIEENFKNWKNSVFQESLAATVMGVLLMTFVVTIFTISIHSFNFVFSLIMSTVLFISIAILCLVDKVKIKKIEKRDFQNIYQ